MIRPMDGRFSCLIVQGVFGYLSCFVQYNIFLQRVVMGPGHGNCRSVGGVLQFETELLYTSRKVLEHCSLARHNFADII
jgi:hypothetical protein